MYKIFSENGMGSNSYLIYDEVSRDALIVDCGNYPREIADFVSRKELTVKYLLLTHAHYDHITHLEDYKCLYPEAQVVIHGMEVPLMNDPVANASRLFGENEVYGYPDITVGEGDEITVGSQSYQVLHTPGHTAGSICLYDKTGQILYTGDTIFCRGRGRTDLVSGNEADICKSISRILSMDGEITLLPGHGMPTVIKHERRYY